MNVHPDNIVCIDFDVSCKTLQRPPPDIFTLLKVLLVASKTITSACLIVVGEEEEEAYSAAEIAANIPEAPPPITAILFGNG